MIPPIHIKDYAYDLPDERIAKYPVAQRDHSKLLIYNHGEISQDVFFNISKYLPKDAVMVFNNTRVIRARLFFQKPTGAIIEIFLLEPHFPADYEQMFQTKGTCQWQCLIGNKKKWKEGRLSALDNPGAPTVNLQAELKGSFGTSQIVQFIWDSDLPFAEIVDMAGHLPIPPYLNRATEQSDLTTYQTVYSKIKGSVAAPTAGLHFTPKVLAAIDACGIDREEVTLHVGAGTFKPVKSEDVRDHEMHSEHFAVSLSTIQKLIRHDACAIAVGTTSVRTLESLYYIGLQILQGAKPNEEGEFHVSQWEPYLDSQEWQNSQSPGIPTSLDHTPKTSPLEALTAIENYLMENKLPVLHASTQIIITPAGYNFKIVKMLVTNFHQPQSTLLLLVSALIGNDWRKVYNYAMAQNFRFLSYGDSSLLIP